MIERTRFISLLTLLFTTCVIDKTCLAGAIHIAADRGRLADVQRLLADDPRLLNQKESNGLTPLFLAARGGHSEVVALLLKQKACVWCISHSLRSALATLPLACSASRRCCAGSMLI